jgi:hypothetical protein
MFHVEHSQMAQDEEAKVVPRGTFCGQLTIPQRDPIFSSRENESVVALNILGVAMRTRAVPGEQSFLESMDTLFPVEQSIFRKGG